MAFNGSEGAPIPLNDAANLTSNYRDAHPDSTMAHFFGKDIIMELLDQPGAMGIRIYYGQDADGNRELVIAAADANMDDMLELIADFSKPCPQLCGGEVRPRSPLQG